MMIYDMEASGKRLKTLRKQADKTQEQVAETVGLEPEVPMRSVLTLRHC